MLDCVTVCAVCRRFVEREYSSKDTPSIAAVSEKHRIETAAGDLLFLKGQAFPGMYGEHSMMLSSSSGAFCDS
jgi:hypothetical protein